MSKVAKLAKEDVEIIDHHLANTRAFLEHFTCPCPVCSYLTAVVKERIERVASAKTLVNQIANTDNGTDNPDMFASLEGIYSMIALFDYDLDIFAKTIEVANLAYNQLWVMYQEAFTVATRDMIKGHESEFVALMDKINLSKSMDTICNSKSHPSKSGPN